MPGSLDHVPRQLIVHTTPTKCSSDFVAHLEQLERLYGPGPGQPTKPVVLVENNGPIHRSKGLDGSACRPRTLAHRDIERIWHDLRAHHLAHQTFADIDTLDRAIHQVVDDLNEERNVLPLDEPQISAMKITQRDERGYITRPVLWVRG